MVEIFEATEPKRFCSRAAGRRGAPDTPATIDSGQGVADIRSNRTLKTADFAQVSVSECAGLQQLVEQVADLDHCGPSNAGKEPLHLGYANQVFAAWRFIAQEKFLVNRSIKIGQHEANPFQSPNEVLESES
jgi:hypothetical protein